MRALAVNRDLIAPIGIAVIWISEYVGIKSSKKVFFNSFFVTPFHNYTS